MTERSRRTVLLAGLVGAAAALTGCGPQRAGSHPTLIDPAEPAPPIAERIALLENRYHVNIGLYAVDLASQRELAHRDSDRFAMCSTFKTYAAARVLQLEQHGELRLTDTALVEPTALVTHSPVTQPRTGTAMMLSELCAAALQYSDNTAANMLLKTIGGPSAITTFARSIGDDASRLDRWETDLNTALPGDERDTSTPRALGRGYRALLTGDVLAGPQRAQLEAWMRGNTTSERSLRAGLPPGWTSADRTGGGDFGSLNAVGIGYGPDGRRLLLSVLTRSQTANPDAERRPEMIADVTRLAVPWLTQPH